jgi:UDP-GlcNAc:undecaprenyl-phosphate GlcNAc-1-phosphate transferase
MDALSLLSAFVPAFALSALLTPLVKWFALKKEWVAKPKQDRWHKKPTALMGGIAIFISAGVPLAFKADFANIWYQLVRPAGTVPIGPSLNAALFIGTAFLFGVGLFDDRRSIKPHSKLVAQILAASTIVFLGFRLHWFVSLTLDTMATLFWIVGITNAFNLIDNMDGLCAGIGLVASICLAVLFSSNSQVAAWTALLWGGAMAGFLIYNFHPAKIFMGDCGSLVIGFGISVLTLNYATIEPSNRLATVMVPVLVLMVPIFDTSLVTVIRILSGRKASTGGRDHTSHRLVLMGFSERKAVLFLYGVGTIAGLSAIFVHISDSLTSPAVIIPVALAIILMGVYLSQLRVYPEKEFSRLRDRSFTPVLLELTYKRHMVLVSLDFILVAFAYYLAYRLRFEGGEFSYYFKVFLKSLPIVIGCKLSLFFITGIYHGLWRYISTNDVFHYLRASILASLASIVAVTFVYRFESFSKGVFLIDFVLTTGLMLGVRGSFRLFLETQKRKTLAGDTVAIYGAGRGGELLLREILNNQQLKVKPIGFIDDDPMKEGKKIQGYPILGGFNKLMNVYTKYGLNGILISFNDNRGLNADRHAAVKAFCREHGLFLKQFRIKLEPIDIIEN